MSGHSKWHNIKYSNFTATRNLKKQKIVLAQF